MSEQQPLLTDYDAESASAGHETTSTLAVVRENTSRFLESRPLHKAVIALITIDAVCVLADLGYTFLSDPCRPEGEAPAWLEVLAHISLFITSFFLIEIPFGLWAFGLQYYQPFGKVPHSSLHLFDTIIIVTTFLLEVVLKGREQELASLLIIFRLWRLVKLVGGVAVGAGELEEENAKKLAETKAKLEEVLATLSVLRDENQRLRARLSQAEVGGSQIEV